MILQNIPSRPQKAAQLIDHLEGLIVSGQLVSGARLPQLRQLQQQFGLSYSTVQRGIAYLCSRGLLEKSGREILIGHPGGTSDRKTIRQIAVYLQGCRLNDEEGLFISALHGVQRAALEYNYRLLVTPFNGLPEDFEVMQRLSGRVSGMILLLEFDRFATEYPFLLPGVGVLMNHDFGGRISLIDVDPINSAALAVNFFRQRGMRTVRIFSDYRSSFLVRARLFEQSWREAGGEVAEFLCHYDTGLFDRPFDNSAGNFFSSDSLAQFYSEKYAAEFPGRRLHENTVMLAVDGKRLLIPRYDRFPTISVDWREIGREAFEECRQLIEFPGRRRRRVWFSGHLYEN